MQSCPGGPNQVALGVLWIVALLWGLTGCGVTGSYIWVDDAPADFFKPQSDIILAIGDMVSVRVFGQDALSAHERIRRDSGITLPLVGDVRAAGKMPGELAQEIEQRLKPFVNDPHVTVYVEESRTRITVLGELGHTGIIDLDGPQGMYEALALAGGLSQFASETKIFVLRTGPNGTYRIRFNYGEITRQEGRAAAFKLQNGDKIFVE